MVVTHGTVSGYTNGRCRCSQCRAAWTKRSREYRAKDPEAARAQNRLSHKRTQARWTETPQGQLVVEARSRPCTDCGGQFPIAAMELHHPDGVGDRKRYQAVNKGCWHYSLGRVRAELATTITLCANCHRIRHG